MTEITDLKPCPFCGSSDLDVFANTVSCDQCGCDGPRQDGPEMYCDRRIAIEAWNRRAEITVKRVERKPLQFDGEANG
jgi:hypothetical protein